ncbi:MAG: 8-oxo-dGTP diphosphatase [Roseiflexaceae bacterium]|nr:8-oxo-dGTP diphosphatase [Roseiflexaceae bacterium]
MPKYTPILATLAYILSPDGQQVLMIHRNARPDDLHFGKYNGLGGKLEPNEDVLTSVRREVREEAGIEAERLTLRGTVSWPGFAGDEDWFAFIFRVDTWSGEPATTNHEGELAWVPIDRLQELNLWDSDRLWLGMVFDDDPRPFHGVAPYESGTMISWSFVRV